MRHHLRRFLVGSLPLLALTLLCASGPTWPANDWPVKKFEVFLGSPTASNFDLGITADQVFGLLDNWVDIDSPTDPPPDVPAAAIAEIESYLGEVAQMLDDMGFAPPLLVPMVKTAAGEPAYRVYYYAYNDSHPVVRSQVEIEPVAAECLRLGLGNVAFGLHDRDTTSLVVLTGVYGTATGKGDFTTELLATSLPDSQVVPDPALEKRFRRSFTTEYKLSILAKADACQRARKSQNIGVSI
jgi:hypothetical protein